MELFSLDYMRRWRDLVLWKEKTIRGGVKAHWKNDMHSITITVTEKASLIIEDRWHGKNVVVGKFDSLERAVRFLEEFIGIPVRLVEVDYNASNS